MKITSSHFVSIIEYHAATMYNSPYVILLLHFKSVIKCYNSIPELTDLCKGRL